MPLILIFSSTDISLSDFRHSGITRIGLVQCVCGGGGGGGVGEGV